MYVATCRLVNGKLVYYYHRNGILPYRFAFMRLVCVTSSQFCYAHIVIRRSSRLRSFDLYLSLILQIVRPTTLPQNGYTAKSLITARKDSKR